jgi:hypothetical protein
MAWFGALLVGWGLLVTAGAKALQAKTLDMLQWLWRQRIAPENFPGTRFFASVTGMRAVRAAGVVAIVAGAALVSWGIWGPPP